MEDKERKITYAHLRLLCAVFGVTLPKKIETLYSRDYKLKRKVEEIRDKFKGLNLPQP